MQDKKQWTLLAKEWLALAQDDELNLCESLKYREGTPAHVCFLAQQMTEKYLKAYLIFTTGDFPHLHDLKELLVLVGSYDASALHEGLKDAAVLLDPYYVGTRYVANLSLEHFTWIMAEQAYAAAAHIKEFILSKLQF